MNIITKIIKYSLIGILKLVYKVLEILVGIITTLISLFGIIAIIIFFLGLIFGLKPNFNILFIGLFNICLKFVILIILTIINILLEKFEKKII